MVVVIGELDGDIGVFNYEGSSPRMRGTHDVIAFHALRPGIIPAYARNTCRNDTRGCCTWDHPRVCGEHPRKTWNRIRQAGSSPRMRGTHSRRLQRRHPQGIIPAYAGNTYGVAFASAMAWDHPRVCGEHVNVPDSTTAVEGSSPRMRGTLVERRHFVFSVGIIPAYAGNTTIGTGCASIQGDHPRVCGEH